MKKPKAIAPSYEIGTTFKLAPVSSNKIRIGILSDMHSGHFLGLTSPDFWRPLDAEDPAIRLLALRQREYWDTYLELIRQAGPVDHLLVNGDSIDGDGFRLSGAETICESHDQMAEMAAKAIKKWVDSGITKTIHMIGGTPSHTWFGPIDVEKLVKEHVITKSPSVTYEQAGTVEFTFKSINRSFKIMQRHDTPKGSIQAGGAGPGAIRQAVKLDMESIYNLGQAEKLADLYVFSHAHEAHFSMQPVAGRNKYVIVTPCLQGSGSVYGRTKCAGVITWGITVLELQLINGEISFSCKFLTRNLNANRPPTNRVIYAKD
ncbi:MAG: hypothetical protein ACOYB3_01240 [Azonexus sp.]